MLKGCPVDAIHSLQLRTLGSMGYRTRIALSNKSSQRPQFATGYRVDVSVFRARSGGGVSHHKVTGVATLAVDAIEVIDCTQFHDGPDDATLIVHLVPTRFADQPTADIEREELFFLASIQDHYVEYYRDDGCSAGVLYQTGPFNHPKLAPKATTLIQAPKFYVSSQLDSKLSLLNAAVDPSYSRVAKLRCTVVGAGTRWTWTEEVPPFEPVLISIRDRLARRGIAVGDTPVFLCLYAVCENATVIPLTIQHDETTGALGIEHSQPPDVYAELVKGPVRAKAMERLVASPLFEGQGR